MTNKVKGEFSFEAFGQTYVGVLDFNAFAELEAITGEGFLKIHQRFNSDQMRLGDIRAMFYAALKGRHPELTLGLTGGLIQEVGLPVVLEKIQQAVEASFPSDDTKGGEPAAGGENPSDKTTPAGGTGTG